MYSLCNEHYMSRSVKAGRGIRCPVGGLRLGLFGTSYIWNELNLDWIIPEATELYHLHLLIMADPTITLSLWREIKFRCFPPTIFSPTFETTVNQWFITHHGVNRTYVKTSRPKITLKRLNTDVSVICPRFNDRT